MTDASAPLPPLPPQWLSLLLENLGDAVFVVDREGRIGYWSRGGEKLFGIAAREMLGADLTKLPLPEDAGELIHARNLAFTGEIISDLEIRMSRPGGGPVTVLLSMVPILGESGEVEHLAGIAKDITVLRVLEEKALAGEKLETVREMMVTLNHQMNQPLAVAGCYLGMLLDDGTVPDEEVRQEYLGEIEGQLDRVAELLRRIADMEEVRSVEYTPEQKMIDIDGPPRGSS